MFPFGSSAAATRTSSGVPPGKFCVEPKAVVSVFVASWMARSAAPGHGTYDGVTVPMLQKKFTVRETGSAKPPFICTVAGVEAGAHGGLVCAPPMLFAVVV